MALATLVLLAGAPAHATTHLFAGGAVDVELELTGSGIPVTLSGGQILYRALGFTTNHDGAIYATTSRIPGYGNPLTITFAQPVTGILGTLLNLGATRLQFGTAQLSPQGIRQLNVPGPLTQLTLEAWTLDADLQLTEDWDFAVFNLRTDQGAIVLPAIAPPPAPVDVAIAKIADNQTPIPGGTGSFSKIAIEPAIHDGTVAFNAGASSLGIYTGNGGPLEVIADTSTTVPGTSMTFASVGSTAGITDTAVVFNGSTTGRQGVYLAIAGEPLAVVADSTMPAPGTTGSFSGGWGSPAAFGTDVVFLANGPTGLAGVYTNRGGSLVQVAQRNGPMPESDGTFSTLSSPVIGAGTIAFLGAGTAPDGMGGTVPWSGVYRFADGAASRVADLTTPIPDGSGTFTGFSAVEVEGDAVYFTAGGPDGQRGIYRWLAGAVETIVDTSTPVPDGALTFQSFGSVAASGSVVAFHGHGFWGQSGLYLLHDGVVRAVISQNNPIDGDRIAAALSLGAFGLHGSDVVTRAVFQNSQGFGLFRLSVDPLCGDGVVGGDEECDDGNHQDGDGCSALCRVEDFCTQACARPEAMHVSPSNAPLVGTPGDDILCGDDRANTLRGNRGDDVLCGFGGDDSLKGHQGDDRLEGGDGDDSLAGDSGDDVLDGGDGDDKLRGHAGDDVIDGGPGDDHAFGDGGDDEISGGEGDDVLRGGPGADFLDGGPGTDRLLGQSGADACENGEAVATCENPS